jgi:hypothetical protein
MIFLPLILCLLTTFGCTYNQTLKDAWKFSNRQYRAYVNTPVSIDMEDTGDPEDYELALGEAVMTLDDQLQRFIRTMENGDSSPDQTWVLSLMRRFPWLSGVALVDAGGNLLARHPEYFMKEFDAGPLLEADSKQRISDLRAYVQQSPLGPEIYLAHPVFTNGELRGLIVAFFDPRALAGVSPEAGRFMLASPAGVLWAGDLSVSETPVGQADWNTLLSHSSRGILGSSDNKFFWIVRYIGNLPLVYAISTSAVALPQAMLDLEPPPEELVDAPPLRLSDPALATGEVGNIGRPDVSPSHPAPDQPPSTSGSLPLEE